MQRWYSMLPPRSARSLGWVAVVIAFALAGLGLTKWALGVSAIEGLSPHAIPVKPMTAVCLVLSSAALLCLLSRNRTRRKNLLVLAAGVAVTSIGLVGLATYLVEAATGWSSSWGALPGLSILLAPTLRMPAVAAVFFSIFGIALLLLGTGTRPAADAAHLALLPVTLMGYMLFVDTLLNVHAFYAWTSVRVAPNTGLAFCALCLAAFSARTDTSLVRVFAGEGAGSTIARRMLPGLLGLPLLIGWLRIRGEHQGLFSSEFGVALVAITYTVCLLGLLWLIARSANRTGERLLENESRHRTLFETMVEGFSLNEIIVDSAGEPCDFRYLEVNPAFERHTGLRAADTVGRTAHELFPNAEPIWVERYGRLALTGEPAHFEAQFGPLGRWFEVSAYQTEPGRFAVVLFDSTERKQAEQERELAIEFLQLVNNSTGTRDLAQSAAMFFQQRSGCEAVGIRLRDGDDYPYYETRGFPAEFVRLENSLCTRDNLGRVVSDSAGHPTMECMCGNVVQGRFDPSKPFFTENGSFWSNCTTELLATGTEAERHARTRNRCNGEGYESVALIALHEGADRLGLLQLNDRRKGMFSPGIIALWERLVGYLAVALAKFEAEEALRESERARGADARLLDTIITSTDNRLAYLGKDLRYKRVNAAYAENAGMEPEAFVGRHRLEVFPNAPDVAEMLQRVLDTGEPEVIPEYTGVPRYRPQVGLKTVRIYAVPVRDERGEVEGVVSSMVDITDQVRARTRLVNAERARAEMAEGLNAEVNHRMKNNLMLVSAMLQMQLDEGIEDAPHALQLAISRISALSAVHEEMYAVHADRVRLEQVLRRVVGMVTDALAGQEVEVEFAGDSVEVDSRMGSLVAIIANELVTNAIKHGGQENGRRRISVELRAQSRERLMDLRIWNSGNPVPADFDPVRQAGLGLQLVRILAVQQAGGTFTMQPRENGTLAAVSMNASRMA